QTHFGILKVFRNDRPEHDCGAELLLTQDCIDAVECVTSLFWGCRPSLNLEVLPGRQSQRVLNAVVQRHSVNAPVHSVNAPVPKGRIRRNVDALRSQAWCRGLEPKLEAFVGRLRKRDLTEKRERFQALAQKAKPRDFLLTCVVEQQKLEARGI